MGWWADRVDAWTRSGSDDVEPWGGWPHDSLAAQDARAAHHHGPREATMPYDHDLAAAITERDGFATIDPSAPGGVRALNDTERAVLIGTDDVMEQAAVAEDAAGPWANGYDIDDGAFAPVPVSPADQSAAYVDEVERRTADPSFPYSPTAEYGTAEYREPRTDTEAALRSAWLAESAPATGGPVRQETEAESAYYEAHAEADRASRAHDPGAQHDAEAEAARLEALLDLRPAPDAPTHTLGDDPFVIGPCCGPAPSGRDAVAELTAARDASRELVARAESVPEPRVEEPAPAAAPAQEIEA